jgi:hypothetical protein
MTPEPANDGLPIVLVHRHFDHGSGRAESDGRVFGVRDQIIECLHGAHGQTCHSAHGGFKRRAPGRRVPGSESCVLGQPPSPRALADTDAGGRQSDGGLGKERQDRLLACGRRLGAMSLLHALPAACGRLRPLYGVFASYSQYLLSVCPSHE